MLVRKENEIEIWTDTMKKGTGKATIAIGIGAIIILTVLMIIIGCDFSVVETYYILGLLFLPCVIILICGFIFIKKENNKNLIARVNSEYVELFNKKDNKQIKIQQITKINKVSSSLGSFIVLFYSDNKKEQKYSFGISTANKNLLAIAIKEYNNDVVVEEH